VTRAWSSRICTSSASSAGLPPQYLGLATKLKPAGPRFRVSLNGPVPFIFVVHSPGFDRSAGIR
jgi:hypothetical protein